MQSHARLLFLRPAGLADGLAPKEQRYPRCLRGIRPMQLWVPGSLASAQGFGIRAAPYRPKTAKFARSTSRDLLTTEDFPAKSGLFRDEAERPVGIQARPPGSMRSALGTRRPHRDDGADPPRPAITRLVPASRAGLHRGCMRCE